MDIITVTAENLGREHICCAISAKADDPQICAKKEWMAQAFPAGLTFKKCDVRGKCFIEYIPAEAAWAPVEAPGYMYINCLWVAGKFQGQGYSSLLLDACIRDSKERGRRGLAILSAKKKMGFLADPKYLRHKGFRPCDTARPYFELMYLPFSEEAGGPPPRFREQAKAARGGSAGFTLFYTHQCPFNGKYAPLLQRLAAERGIPFEAVRFTTAEQAQGGPSPFSTFSLFYNGEFVTHEILSEKKFLSIAEKLLSA